MTGAREKPDDDQREEHVELHFDPDRPQRPADRTEGRLIERMEKRQVRGELPERVLRRGELAAIDDRERDERDAVRRNDLHRTAFEEMSQFRRRPPRQGCSRVRIIKTETADEKNRSTPR